MYRSGYNAAVPHGTRRVFAFLFDYKMEVARQLLASGAHNVNEVGLKVGYSTASHFIAAFKKKFGTTPKKFIVAQSS